MCLGQQEHTEQDAQKVCSARPQRVKAEEVHTAFRVGRSPFQWVLANGKAPTASPTSEKLLRNAEGLNNARTKLDDFFSILSRYRRG